MAINPETQYPGKIAPASADYPFGAARNITVPGDGTGTPWEAALVNDIFGFQQSLLSAAGIVPNGTPEKVGASQYLDAVFAIVGRMADSVAEAITLDLDPGVPVRTMAYYGGWAAQTAKPVGGADYIVFTLAQYRTILGDGAWVPDEQGEAFTMTNGNVLVLVELVKRGDVTKFGAQGNGIRDCYPAVEAAARWLLRGEYPGGELYWPSTDKWYYMGTQGHDLWQYFLDEQGLVDGDLFLPGGTVANGKLVRGTEIRLKGEGLVKLKTAKGGSFVDSDLFKWGRYLGGVPVNAGMGIDVEGLDIEGPGSVGHTATSYIPGAGGYASTNDANLGTTDTSTICFNASLISPMGSIRNTRVRYFNKALENEFGFGLEWNSGSIQWCNIGVNPRTNTTNFSLGPALEIELNAIGVWTERADAVLINGTVIEANQAEMLIQQSRFVTVNDAWFEGSSQASVFLRNVPGAPSLNFDNRNITFNNCVGLNVDSSGSLRNFRANRCPLNLQGETFGVSLGEVFEDVVYDNCTIDGNPFDFSVLTTSGTITDQDITIIGPAVGKQTTNYGAREPRKLIKNVSSASVSAVEGFRLDVDNVYTTCRIEITGTKNAAAAGGDVQAQTFKYVGAIVRRPGANPVVDWDTTRSYVNNHATTGSNVPVTVATPSITTVSGGAGDPQVLSVEFPTGTAVAATADTRFEAILFQENDAVEFA